MFQRWVDYEPQYLLYPGDQIDIVVQSAPELSRTLTVGPDGRITMPMTSSIMAAGRNLPFVQNALKAELAKQLRDPTVAVTSRAFAPQQIFVGGQVGQQGTYTTGRADWVFGSRDYGGRVLCHQQRPKKWRFCAARLMAA